MDFPMNYYFDGSIQQEIQNKLFWNFGKTFRTNGQHTFGCYKKDCDIQKQNGEFILLGFRFPLAFEVRPDSSNPGFLLPPEEVTPTFEMFRVFL